MAADKDAARLAAVASVKFVSQVQSTALQAIQLGASKEKFVDMCGDAYEGMLAEVERAADEYAEGTETPAQGKSESES